MESLKHPGTIIASLDAFAIVGTVVYFSRENRNLQDKIDKVKEQSDKILSSLKETMPMTAQTVDRLKDNFESLATVAKKDRKRVVQLEDQVASLEESVASLVNLLVKKGSLGDEDMKSISLGHTAPTPQRRVSFARSSRRDDSEEDSGEESEERPQRRRRTETRNVQSGRSRSSRTDVGDDDISRAVAAAREGGSGGRR